MKTKSFMTLDRVLSRFGLASRTDARRAILEGRMKVNGRIVRNPDLWVRTDQARFTFDNRPLRPSHKLYVAYYKPKGVLTSHGDPKGRPTVYDNLDPGLGWLAPVGRLDRDSSGILLLTNDTDFANYITNPASRVPKHYRVKLNAIIGDEILASLRSGVEISRGERALPTGVKRLEDRGNYSWIEVVLVEGKNREVRRMMDAVGFTVLKLVRTRIGHLTLAGLDVGGWRELTSAELAGFGYPGGVRRTPRTASTTRDLPDRGGNRNRNRSRSR
jgi:23S rRNA pseudouridine2605 synthase